MLVKVPCSSANIGPGFDCFGIAWQCYDEIEFLPRESGLIISGCPEKYQTADNLAYRAYCEAVCFAGEEPCGLEIRFVNTSIPTSRGLGSSAALTVAGVVAANELQKLKMSKKELLKVATAVEGHPDNVAPALLGGFIVSTMDGDNVITARFPISDKLYFTALIPDKELSTRLARSVLPEQVARDDAIFNVSRAALLLRAMEDGDAELLSTALRDRLYQRYRSSLIEGFEEAADIARSCGADGICISGAGSTLLSISTDESIDSKLIPAIAEAFPAWKVLPLKTDFEGVKTY